MDHLLNLEKYQQVYSYEIARRLPALLPEHEWFFHDDDRAKWPGTVVGQFDDVAADLVLNFSGNPQHAGLPTVTFVFDAYAAARANWLEKILARFRKPPVTDWSDVRAVLVPHRALRTELVEKHPALATRVRVVGAALPPEIAALSPADSVTRRITKEVYGREKSYFLAPATDNLERLIAAYDLFRARCPEQVLLLLARPQMGLPRAVRGAIKASPYRADISVLPLLNDAEYWKVYSSARAILYPALAATFPVEILKAWRAGVPVLATDNDVLGGGGAQVRGENVKSVAEGMVALVTTPFLASGMVANGSRRLASFTWEAAAERTADVLRSELAFLTANT